MLGKVLTAVLLTAVLIVADSNTPAQINNSTVRAEAQTATSKANEILPTMQQPSPETVKPVEPEAQLTATTVAVQIPMSNRDIGMQMAQAKGWTGDQWLCLEKLWTNESNWRHTVSNYDGSGAYGIPQALPAEKMASHGSDYLTNPRTQIAWGLDYVAARYSTPCNALHLWESRLPHWY